MGASAAVRLSVCLWHHGPRTERQICYGQVQLHSMYISFFVQNEKLTYCDWSALHCLPIMRGALRKPQAGAAHSVQINTNRKLDILSVWEFDSSFDNRNSFATK